MLQDLRVLQHNRPTFKGCPNSRSMCEMLGRSTPVSCEYWRDLLRGRLLCERTLDYAPVIACEPWTSTSVATTRSVSGTPIFRYIV